MSDDPDETEEDFAFERGKARLNRSVAAMMQRGLDNKLAKRLHEAKITLGALKQLDDAALSNHGLTEIQIAGIRKGARAIIPFANIAKVLWDNRFTCCVCRNAALAVIIHHIDPWAESHNHGVENLAVLCLEHHARAHRRGDLEQNLSARQLREFKSKWEDEVRHLDPKAILDASRLDGYHWWWFNHVRVFEIAQKLGIKLTEVPGYANAKAAGWLNKEGLISADARDSNYLYEGGYGQFLYNYVRGVVEAVLSQAAIFNVSDDLDPGFLSRVISPGDIILVNGKHYYKRLNKVERGPGQSSEVRREANGVRVSFTVDRWEAVANSAWSGWLLGAHSAASIVRVGSVERNAGKLLLKCTGLAIGGTLQGLSNRSYLFATWKDPEIDEDDGWLDDFGDEPADIQA
jgi:hypothetical protein